MGEVARHSFDKGFKSLYKSVMNYNDALKNMYQRDITKLAHKKKLASKLHDNEENWITEVKTHIEKPIHNKYSANALLSDVGYEVGVIIYMGEEFTAEEEARLRAMFERFDTNGDGEISTKELAATLKSFGQEYSENDIKEIIASVDMNGDGSIDFEEFKQLVSRMSAETKSLKTAEELTEAFSVFDRDGDGYISSAELKYALRTLCGVDERVAQEIVIEADCDADGQIGYGEFSRYLSMNINKEY